MWVKVAISISFGSFSVTVSPGGSGEFGVRQRLFSGEAPRKAARVLAFWRQKRSSSRLHRVRCLEVHDEADSGEVSQ